MDDNSPLCCCEYINRNNERSHVLGCCCNCEEIDRCCDRLLTCRSVSKRELSAAIMSCLDRFRCPWRGGATIVSGEIIFPVIAQPVLVFFLVTVKLVTPFITLTTLFLLYISHRLSNHNSQSRFLYYWTVASVTYIIIVFEHSVVPLSEISTTENYIIVILVMISILFLYAVKRQGPHVVTGIHNGEMISNGAAESLCPICRVKVYPRHFHCHICQVCVPKYEYHCYWLDTCLGESNLHMFLVGVACGMFALGYASLLILTTICRPVFRLGVLVPDDCTDVVEDTEMCVCYITAVYCAQLTAYLMIKLLYHSWLISKGFSGPEWKQSRYSICSSSPYSRGCTRNWLHFLFILFRCRHG